MFIIPLIAAFLFLVGGQWWKAGRWFMGVPIFFIAIFTGHAWYSVFAVFTYWIATSAFSYGDKMWTSRIFGRWVSMILSGVAFGLAAFPILGYWAIAQAIVSGVGFGVLKYLDDTDRFKNPGQEVARGFIGTILLAFI